MPNVFPKCNMGLSSGQVRHDQLSIRLDANWVSSVENEDPYEFDYTDDKEEYDEVKPVGERADKEQASCVDAGEAADSGAGEVLEEPEGGELCGIDDDLPEGFGWCAPVD